MTRSLSSCTFVFNLAIKWNNRFEFYLLLLTMPKRHFAAKIVEHELLVLNKWKYEKYRTEALKVLSSNKTPYKETMWILVDTNWKVKYSINISPLATSAISARTQAPAISCRWFYASSYKSGHSNNYNHYNFHIHWSVDGTDWVCVYVCLFSFGLTFIARNCKWLLIKMYNKFIFIKSFACNVLMIIKL